MDARTNGRRIIGCLEHRTRRAIGLTAPDTFSWPLPFIVQSLANEMEELPDLASPSRPDRQDEQTDEADEKNEVQR